MNIFRDIFGAKTVQEQATREPSVEEAFAMRAAELRDRLRTLDVEIQELQGRWSNFRAKHMLMVNSQLVLCGEKVEHGERLRSEELSFRQIMSMLGEERNQLVKELGPLLNNPHERKFIAGKEVTHNA